MKEMGLWAGQSAIVLLLVVASVTDETNGDQLPGLVDLQQVI
jgi:hypothetical protein